MAAALCAVLPPAGPAALAASPGCAARATRVWTAKDQPALTVEAFADGPDCARAVVTLVVRQAGGSALWAQAFVAGYNFVLRDGTTTKTMQAALRRWIDPAELHLGSTGALPEWAADAEAPGGEFPFHPSEIYANRDDYEALRREDRPLLCVVSGTESILCAVYEDERIDEVGYQSFPG